MAIQFHFQKNTTVSSRLLLKKVISDIFTLEGLKLEFLYFVFCDDAFLLDINQRFLQHDYFTDIITFDLSDKHAAGISGEIYISVDTVRKNALEFKVPFAEELARVVFHGALHLCGFKDKSVVDKIFMSEKEDFYLGRFNKLKRVKKSTKT